MNWRNTLQIKHLFTTNEDAESVDKSMLAIAEVIESKPFMAGFNVTEFYNCADEPRPCELANILLNQLYDYCDANKIWVE